MPSKRLTPATAASPGWAKVVLCSRMLGGAEIFALERMRRMPCAAALHCNRALAELVRQDDRYDGIRLVAHAELDPLASQISWPNLAAAARALEGLLVQGDWLLGNLRATAMQLVSRWAGRNDIFVHDNTHYLHDRVRWMIAFTALRSRRVFFPCRHAMGRLPMRRLLASRLVTEYFAPYQSLRRPRLRADGTLRIVNVGRVEPDKNQALAVRIACAMARRFARIELSLLGAVTDDRYVDALRAMPLPSNLSISFLSLRRSEVQAVLQANDLLLHSSLKESLPLVLFEANAVGLPCFAVEAGGIAEILPRDYLLPPNAEAAASRILTALGQGAQGAAAPAPLMVMDTSP